MAPPMPMARLMGMDAIVSVRVLRATRAGGLPYPGYAIQIASYGMRYVGIFAERICVKHP
jgi:hypothetical protein